MIMKRKSIFYTMALCSILGVFTACEDMFDVTSSSVQYEGSHEINSPADSLYSVIGILSKVQGIADRTVLLGELRGDLVDENVCHVHQMCGLGKADRIGDGRGKRAGAL